VVPHKQDITFTATLLPDGTIKWQEAF
jgi:hypothetical protein